uniref:Uncharacterized protein n=1 Tax=Arundo donax TaxID=35708 RepID=A0A0A9B919_ARUDO
MLFLITLCSYRGRRSSFFEHHYYKVGFTKLLKTVQKL